MPPTVEISCRSYRYLATVSFWIAVLLTYSALHCPAKTLKVTTSKLVERVDFDWNHSGKSTRFAISTQARGSESYPDMLVIQDAGIKPFLLMNKDGGWGRFAVLSPLLKHRNMVSAKRMFFIAAGSFPEAKIYLVLEGEGSSCCVGSLTVLTPDKDGVPVTVFHEDQLQLTDIRPLEDGTGIQLIAKSSDSEAWALKNAETYDPFRIYLLRGTSPAKYDLDLSKAYTLAHYCQWVGPDYNEKFGAIQISNGASNCKTMTRKQFESYSAKHPARFPQN
jgi:hypothetical protein